MRDRIWIPLWIAIVLWAAPAFSQSDANIEAAREAFWEGNDAYVEGDYPAAIAAFEQANRLAPNPQLWEYIGRAYVGMQQYPDAIEAFEQFAQQMPEAADDVAATIEELRQDMWRAASNAVRERLDGALAIARGEQPRSQASAVAELGTRMTNVPIQVTSSPRAAEVFIDGQEFGAFGITPLDTRLFTGPHFIEVHKPFHEPANRVVSVSVPARGETIQVVHFELERRAVEVSVTVRPLTARVTHVSDDGDSTDLGTGGWQGTLPAGPGTFLIQNAGRDRRVEMELDVPEEGGVLDIPLTLSSVSGPSIVIEVGTIEIISQVDEASVKVDGREIGTGLGEFSADLTPGLHRIEVTRDGHQPFVQEVEVTAGQSATIYVNALERSRRRNR